MNVTKNLMQAIVRNIKNTSMLCVNDVELHEVSEEYNEYIIRFKNGNNYTISIFITEYDTQYGYILEDDTYKWYGTAKNKAFKRTTDFMFFLGCKLHEINDYIDKYVME